MILNLVAIALAVISLTALGTVIWLAAHLRRLNAGVEHQFRQHAERHSKRDKRMQELSKQLETYIGVCVKMGDELQELRQLVTPLPERLGKLEQSDPTMVSFIQASRLVGLGASIEDLTQSCGLTKGEAELVSKLHQARRPE
ncbi:DUF2802 domain-containing protein [Pseudomonadaceae bacterium Sa2CUA2]|uniref:DUF2802 domain-containing protein n=1 Tax=Serpens gallinarum TaxID=2763075 RepID=A0ABR8TLW9_9PSED|nr:DUF2802 domain-containing protein [Serpens gallinarum]